MSRKKTTVTDLAKAYFGSPDFARLSRNTRRCYVDSWKHIAEHKVGIKMFTQLMPHRITIGTVETIKDDIVTKRGLAAARLTFALLNNIWEKARRLELVKSNPWLSPRLRGPRKRDTMWTQQQIIRFAYIARHVKKWDDVALMFLLCYELGQRPIDIVTLTKGQVEERDGTLYIYLKQMKTGTFVSLIAPEYLKEAILNLAKREGGSDYLFIDKSGKPRTYESFSHCCATIMRSDKLFDGLQIRDLRRTAITEAHNAKATEWEAMSMGGHKNPQSTIPYRVHSNEAAHEAQRKRWEKRSEVNYWTDPSKPSPRKV